MGNRGRLSASTTMAARSSLMRVVDGVHLRSLPVVSLLATVDGPGAVSRREDP